MSRFTEADRERIRSRLLAEGRELFARFGFERTRIKDVTEAVGIGTSTFYQFFDSKEALYVEVLREERDRLDERIGEAVSAADSPRDEVRTMLRTVFEEIRSNPLISRLIVDNEVRALRDQLTESDRESIAASMRGGDLTYAERWTELDEFRYDDPEIVRGMFRSLAFTTRSQDTVVDRVNEPEYGVIEEHLIDTIVAGLFIDESGRNEGETDEDKNEGESDEENERESDEENERESDDENEGESDDESDEDRDGRNDGTDPDENVGEPGP